MTETGGGFEKNWSWDQGKGDDDQGKWRQEKDDAGDSNVGHSADIADNGGAADKASSEDDKKQKKWSHTTGGSVGGDTGRIEDEKSTIADDYTPPAKAKVETVILDKDDIELDSDNDDNWA